MKKLILFFLLFFIPVGSAYAEGVSIETDSMFGSGSEMISAENIHKHGLGNPTRSSRISLQTVAAPSDTWVVSFSLSLVFLSYRMKKKGDTN
jgi:hypothetical protein